MTKSPNKTWAEARRWIPGLLISGIAIYAIFRIVNFQDLDDAFSTIAWIYLLPGSVLVILWLFLRAIALKAILMGKPTVGQTFRSINIGYLINNLLPLRAGEIGKAIVLGKSSGLGTTFVLSGVVIERAFDLSFAASFLLLSLPFVLEMDWAKSVAILTLVVVFAGLIGLYLMARFHLTIGLWINQLGKRSKLISRFILPQMESFLSGLQVLTDFKRFLWCLLLIGLSWVTAVVLYYVMMFSIADSPQIWWGIFANSMLAMGIALPSAPAALGVFEASLVAGLKLLGIPYANALAYAVMVHFLQFFLTGIFGFYALTKERQSIGSLFAQTRKKEVGSEDPLESTRSSTS